MRDIKIFDIELNGFKNVKHGHIPIDIQDSKASVMGIYGQNGSGKTSVIEAMGFIQTLFMGNCLPEDTVKYINAETKECSIKVAFLLNIDNNKSSVTYEINLRDNNSELIIQSESISYRAFKEGKYSSKHSIAAYTNDDKLAFSPKYRYKELVDNNVDNKLSIAMARKISARDKSSFIFSDEGRKIFAPRFFCNEEDCLNYENSVNVTKDFDYIIQALHEYAVFDLFVITSEHNGPISMEFLMPVSFRIKHREGIAKGDIPILLSGPSEVPATEYEIIETIIDEINIVLKTVIPGMQLELHNYGQVLMADGSDGYRIELLSCRDKVVIPLKYESEGIIKIVSILNVFMCTYNNSSMCMMIDELDSGLFEFLLGEIISVFEKGGKGQLVFTSHNLRALEMIDKKHLAFSTTNEQNRYIQFKHVKNSNNLRDLYIRTITLGGQDEEIYAETDSIEISRALRKAGRKANNGKN